MLQPFQPSSEFQRQVSYWAISGRLLCKSVHVLSKFYQLYQARAINL